MVAWPYTKLLGVSGWQMLKHLLRRALGTLCTSSSPLLSTAVLQGGTAGLILKAKNIFFFRTIKCMVLHYQEIRLEIQGLPGLGQAEKKIVPIHLLHFEISMRLLSSRDTLKPSLLGLFIPGWILNLSYITLNPYPPAWSQLWASVAHWESGYLRTLVASCKSAPPPPPRVALQWLSWCHRAELCRALPPGSSLGSSGCEKGRSWGIALKAGLWVTSPFLPVGFHGILSCLWVHEACERRCTLIRKWASLLPSGTAAPKFLWTDVFPFFLV